MHIDFGDFFGKYGPALAVVAGGIMAWGQLSNDVQDLKDAQPKVTETRENVIEMRMRQQALERKVDEVDKKVEKVLDKLDNLSTTRSTRRPAASDPAGEDVSR